MADENLAFLLDEAKAYWFKDSSVLGLLPDGTLIREWRNIPIAHRNACIAALKARRIETAPKANTESYTGVYRILRIEDSIASDASGRAHSVTIREFLAKGLATSLTDATQVVRVGGEVRVPGTATTWPASPAHPGGTSAIQQDSKSVTLRWINLDPQKLEAINAEQADVTKTSLTVNGETLTGPWYNITRNSGQTDDGSGFYEEVWSLAEFALEAVEKVGDRQVTANRFVQNIPKNRVKTVLDAEIAAMTNYGAAGYTYRQKIYWNETTASLLTEATANVAKNFPATADTYIIAEEDFEKKIERRICKSAAAIPASVKQDAGKTGVTRGGMNTEGDYDYEVEITTWNDLSIAAPADVTSQGNAERRRGSIVLTQTYENSVAAPTPLASGEYGEVRYRKNKAGRYDGIKTIETYDFTIPGWTLGETASYTKIVVIHRGDQDGRWYRGEVTLEIKEFQRGTLAAAIGDITGKYDYGDYKSKVEALGDGQYRVTAIQSVSAPNWGSGPEPFP